MNHLPKIKFGIIEYLQQQKTINGDIKILENYLLNLILKIPNKPKRKSTLLNSTHLKKIDDCLLDLTEITSIQG